MGAAKKVSAVNYKTEGRGSSIGMPVRYPIITCQSKPEKRPSYHIIIRSLEPMVRSTHHGPL